MRYVQLIMILLFALCILVQYNDPDPLRWIVLYLIPLVLTALALANIHTPIPLLGALGYIVGGIYLMPGWSIDHFMLLTEKKMYSPDVELAREGAGLILCALWMLVLSYLWYKNRTAQSAPPQSDPPQPAAE